jgi:hypothetical protein
MQSGRHYAWETCGPLAAHLQENGQNRKKYNLQIVKLTQHAYEEGHHTGSNSAKILHITTTSRNGKYKQSGYMTCQENPISEPNLQISHVLFPLNT